VPAVARRAEVVAVGSGVYVPRNEKYLLCEKHLAESKYRKEFSDVRAFDVHGSIGQTLASLKLAGKKLGGSHG